MESYDHFHDSCIVEVDYTSGSYVDDDLFMDFGEGKDYILRVVFERQASPRKLELVFSGVKQFNINGYGYEYTSCFYEAFIGFHSFIINTYNKKEKVDVVTWSTNKDINNLRLNPLEEGNNDYIVARKLKWKIL